MHVVISGYYGYNNIGDEAILKSIVQALRFYDKDIEITVLSNNIEHTKKTYKVNAISRWNLIKIFKTIKKSDGLISGGGSLLQDVTSSRSILYYITIMNLAKLAKKPLFIYAQGVGPINFTKNQKKVQRIINKADKITLRDEESKILLESIGVNKDIKIVPDPVMGFELDDKELNFNNEYRDKNYITISIREWKKTSDDFLEKIAKSCDKISNLGYEIVFIPMHGELDKIASEKVVNLMKNKAHIFSYDASIEEKILCIKYSKLLIGMRLHALIFAASVNTPMIGISYDPKIDSFLKLVNQPCIGSTEDKWSSQDLEKASKYILENLEKEKLKLESISKKLKNTAKDTAGIVIDEFNRR